jgi:polar amino acid transport system substrate-binding protein
MKKLLTILTTMVLFSLSSVGISAEKLVFFTADWPPYVLVKDGELTGIHVEIVREACKRLGFEADVRLVPWARAVKYAQDGQTTGIFTPKKTAERSEFLYFSSEPIGTEKNVLVALKQRALKANHLDDLKDKSFGLVRNYSYSQEFDNYQGLKKEEAVDDVQMLMKLDKGRNDLATGEEGALKFIVKQKHLQEIETVYVLSELPTYVAFSKKALGEKGQDFAEKFGQVLRQLKEEGFIQKIESKYF